MDEIVEKDEINSDNDEEDENKSNELVDGNDDNPQLVEDEPIEEIKQEIVPIEEPEPDLTEEFANLRSIHLEWLEITQIAEID